MSCKKFCLPELIIAESKADRSHLANRMRLIIKGRGWWQHLMRYRRLKGCMHL